MSLKNGCNNLYLYNKLFKITLKPNSYLTSIFCHGLVNPSTLTVPNINIKKTVGNLYVVSNVTEKSCKMVKHTQTIRRQIADELIVFDHFVKLALFAC